MPAWGALGMQVAGEAASGAMGILAQRIGKNYDRKQWIKDFETQAPRQMALEKQMMDYQQQKQYEMWLKTGIGGQMAEMKKAGVNPGLLLGMSGSGGATVGGGMPGTAPITGTDKGTGNAIAAGMGIDPADTQLKLSQARLNNTQADKIAGVDTENVRADTGVKNEQINNLIAQTKTESSKRALLDIQKKLTTFDTDFAEQTFDDRKKTVHANFNEAMGRAKEAEARGEISYGTMKEAQEIIKNNAANGIILNSLMKAQTENVKADTKLKGQQTEESKARINQMEQEIMKWQEELGIEWSQVDIDQKRNEIIETLGKLGLGVEVAKKVIDEIKDVIPWNKWKQVKGFKIPKKSY